MPNAPSPSLPAWKVPTRLSAAWFSVRVWGHAMQRAFADVIAPRAARHPPSTGLVHLPVLAEHRSPLWTDGRPEEFVLVAGKVENLHSAVAAHLRLLYPAPVDELAWQMPARAPGRAVARASATPPVVVFPASALARKGAHELAQALRHLGWSLLVLGSPSTDPALWDGIAVEHADYHELDWLDRADVVALPAWIEHSPRALLLALAHGLPVVATRACGLPASARVIEVSRGHVDGLVAALRQALATRPCTEGMLTPP